MQLSIFFFETQQRSFGTWVRPFFRAQPSMPCSFRSFGGLKWSVLPIDCSAIKRSPHFSPTASFDALVGSNGLGPSTSRLSGVCSNQLSYEPMCGGGNRVRTDDPLLAGQVLYQLSYTPVSFSLPSCENKCSPARKHALLKTNKKEILISDRLNWI